MNTTSWLQKVADEFELRGGRLDKGLPYIERVAAEKALQFTGLGSAYVDLQPGNATSYLLVVTDLCHDQAAIDRDLFVRNQPEGTAVPPLVAFRRPNRGMATRAGGEVLVSWLNRNRCAVFGGLWEVHPDSVMEHMEARPGDAYPLALFLTSLFSNVDALWQAEARAG